MTQPRCLITICLLFGLCLSASAQMPGLGALVSASTDIIVAKVLESNPTRAIEGGRDNVKFKVMQSMKGPLKTDDVISVYYHLLWTNAETLQLEPPKFVADREYLVFLHAIQEVHFHPPTESRISYELADQWLSVQPPYLSLIKTVSKTVRDQRLKLDDRTLTSEERALLTTIAEQSFDEIIDAAILRTDLPVIARNNQSILAAWTAWNTAQGRASLVKQNTTMEGLNEWKYLLIQGKEATLIIDNHGEKPADRKIHKSALSELRLVYLDPKKFTLEPLGNQDPVGKVLWLQYQLAGHESFDNY